ncbi:HAMP domain-containing protein [Clostridiales bacterium COT073_COT-073]|nr:HAMP domain-containing protein [Clostridiales bacterium COT073_COT-073]
MNKFSELKRKLHFTFLNLPLRMKLISIVLFCLALLAATSIIGIQKLRQRYDQLLYQAYRSVLTVSAGTLCSSLDKTTDYIKKAATDLTIQKGLASIKEGKYLSATTVRNIEREMQKYINDELNPGLYGMTIYTTKGTFYNSSFKYDNGYDASLGTKFSEDELKTMVSAAPEEKTLWVTEYSNSYGLMVVQNIRRISPMRLDSLGMMVGCLNLQPMIHTCTTQLQQETCYFALLNEAEDVFYTYSNMKQPIDFLQKINADEKYAVVKENGNCYFVIRSPITKNGWNYIYAIPYDAIEITIRNSAISIVLMLCLCIAIAVGAAMLMIRQILRDIDKLMGMINNVSDVDFESVGLTSEETRRNDEVAILMQQFTRMSNKIDHLIQDNYESRLLAQEAKLQALEMQINPHFLYNTLESIRCCAKLGENKDVCHIVESLGSMMHLIMSNHNNELHLQQELDLIDDYILIQKIRFDQRLFFSKEIESGCGSTVLPKLTILPLVENAVIHGMENCSDTCYIELKIWQENEQVRIQIRNTGTRFIENFFQKLQNSQIKPTRHGIGLLNVDSRLKIFFKKDYSIKFYNQDNQAVVDLIIPYWTTRISEKEGR